MKKFNTEQRATLQTLANDLNTTPFEWLKGRTYSEAFVICIGAGPWKFERRKKIQGEALRRLEKRDLADLKPAVKWYPLSWQNDFVNNMIKNLSINNLTMNKLCCKLACSHCTKPELAREYIFNFAGCPKGSKVLSLFCRDGIGIPSFPIDRHVKRFLVKYNLPTNEGKMIKLCQELELDPCKIAIGCVRASSNMDNPDWSI